MAYPREISIADAIKQYGLPKSHRVHWSDTRKADVVQAVHDRAISFHEARERYLLSRREFEQWESNFPPQRPFSRASERSTISQTEDQPNNQTEGHTEGQNEDWQESQQETA